MRVICSGGGGGRSTGRRRAQHARGQACGACGAAGVAPPAAPAPPPPPDAHPVPAAARALAGVWVAGGRRHGNVVAAQLAVTRHHISHPQLQLVRQRLLRTGDRRAALCGWAEGCRLQADSSAREAAAPPATLRPGPAQPRPPCLHVLRLQHAALLGTHSQDQDVSQHQSLLVVAAGGGRVAHGHAHACEAAAVLAGMRQGVVAARGAKGRDAGGPCAPARAADPGSPYLSRYLRSPSCCPASSE